MSTFDKREEAFERQFAHDEELKFKAEARRNKLLGLWAAEKLGKTGPEADTYAKAVVAADFEEAGDGDVLRKVLGDFNAKGLGVTEGRGPRQDERIAGDGGGTDQRRKLASSRHSGARMQCATPESRNCLARSHRKIPGSRPIASPRND